MFFTEGRLLQNGMLCHSLETLDFKFFLQRISPLSLFVGIFCSFCPFNRGPARLQARGTAMNAHTRLKCNKQDKIPTKKEQFPEVVGNSHYEKIMESP